MESAGITTNLNPGLVDTADAWKQEETSVALIIEKDQLQPESSGNGDDTNTPGQQMVIQESALESSSPTESKVSEGNLSIDNTAVLPASITSSVTKLEGATPESSTIPKKSVIRSPTLLFPVRVGITWKKGERLEAMDYYEKWYPSKIVDIDVKEKYVLIHFEGWNARYDEWLPMDSPKLRPQTRHSERKDRGWKKSKNIPQPIYRRGDTVLARWTDCKKYAAKINRMMPDGTFEVVFYDGVSRNVQPNNIARLPDQWQTFADNIELPPLPTSPQASMPPSPTKPSFKTVKLQLPATVTRRPSVEDKSPPLSLTKSKNRHMEKSIKKSLAHISGTFKKSPLKTHRLKALQGVSKKPLKKIGAVATAVGRPKKTPQSLDRSVVEGSSTESADAANIVKAMAVTSPCISEAGGQASLEVIPSMDGVVQESPETTIQGIKRVKQRAHTSESSVSPKKKSRYRKLKEAGLIPKGHGSSEGQRRHTINVGAPVSSNEPSSSFASSDKSLVSQNPSVSAPPVPPPVPSSPYYIYQYFVPSKAFVVEEDHNPFKCPFEGCPKEFRKEKLLTSHIKYYHTNQESITALSVSTSTPTVSQVNVKTTISSIPSSPQVISPVVSLSPITSQTPVHLVSSSNSGGQTKRRRRKTDSICSTDSDISVSSKGKPSSKRQRHDSEISVTGSPDPVYKDLWADMKLKGGLDSMAEECGETEDEDIEQDVVNCVCRIQETNGLMIQCDVCMCWQHFTCVDTDGSGKPPANYVCLACERPKGVRDSRKYLYDTGWERRGELPTFPFQKIGKQDDDLHNDENTRHKIAMTASLQKVERMRKVAAACIPLMSSLVGTKALLHSTRRQIKISKEEDESEFQLWQTDWDNWTKPEEDLTLTPPHSVEAAPSPAASTFMFPHAPSSPPPPSATTTLPLPPTSATTPLPSSSTHNAPPQSPACNTSPSSLSTRTSFEDNFKNWLSAKDSTKPKMPSSSCSTLTSVSSSVKLDFGKTNQEAEKLYSREDNSQTQEAPPSKPSPLTPPMASSQTQTSYVPQSPQSARSSSRMASMMTSTAIGGRMAADLVCDLFTPGPGGDAASCLQSTASSMVEVSLSSTTSPTPGSSSSSTATTTTTPFSNTDGAVRNNQSQDEIRSRPLGDNRSRLPSDTGSGFGDLHGDAIKDDDDDDDHDDDDDNDTDTAEESADPYRDCERNLLIHIGRTHDHIDEQLDQVEKFITDLENTELNDPNLQVSAETILNDVPALKKSLGKLSRNLNKIQRISLY